MSKPTETARQAAHSGHSYWSAQIRALSHPNAPTYRAHLLRLGDECRRARFGNCVSDKFLQAYVEHIEPTNALVIGWYDGAELRGAVELRSLDADWCPTAEIAFSIEQDWRRRGIGTALMFHAMAAARKLALERLFMSCHAFNRPMVRIAERAAAEFDFSNNECSATISVHEALSPDVGRELSDIVIALDLRRPSTNRPSG